jgi:putative N6-adenine-specific DNA methylase
VIVRLAEFRATAFWELEKQAKRVPWDRVLLPGSRATFQVSARKSKLYHQRGIEQRLMQALAHRVPGAGPGEVKESQLFVVRVDHDRVLISADSSGDLLHQRGYRQATAKAPIRETLAAAMLLGGGWDPQLPLIDPLCGSGTIPIEAALLARRIPPGWRRQFQFERWPEFDQPVWHRIREAAEGLIQPRTPAVLQGSDRDSGAIDAARANAHRAGVGNDVQFERQALSGLRAPDTPGWILTNPPYGVRVGEASRLRDLYARLGQLLRGRLREWGAGMLAAEPGLTRQTGIEWQERWRARNGGIPVKFLTRDPGVSS